MARGPPGPKDCESQSSKLRANLKDQVEHLPLAPAPAVGQFKGNVKDSGSRM